MVPLGECLLGVGFAMFCYTVCLWGCAVLIVSYTLLPHATHNAVAIKLQELGLTAMMWFLEGRFEFVISGDPLPPWESALVVCNHQSNDWAAIYCLGLRQGNLGAVRCFLKRSLMYIPGFGWSMYLMSWPSVSRDWDLDGPYLQRLFSTYQRDRTPLVLWLFPEGTRLTPDKRAASQAHAREKGHPVLQHVLLPRHRAFTASVRGVAGAVDHCYDCTVAYSGWGGRNPKTFDFVFRSADLTSPKVHLHVKRIPLKDLPGSDEGLSQWLMASFQAKDALLADFEQNGRFPGDQRVEVVPRSVFTIPCLFFGPLTVLTWIATLWALTGALTLHSP